jgi:hypothetical protein
MEGAMGAWPEFEGGYGLKNLSTRLPIPENQRKFKLDIAGLTAVAKKVGKSVAGLQARHINKKVLEEIRLIATAGDIPWDGKNITPMLCAQVLAVYNKRDVTAMRSIYYAQIPRLPAVEQDVALRTHQQRKWHFLVDQEKIEELIATLDKNAGLAEAQAAEYLTDDQVMDVFNRTTEDGSLRSVRSHRLKRIVNEDMGVSEQFESTSLKKISPVKMAANPSAAAVITAAARANKMLSHRRRSRVFTGVMEVDSELGYGRAHTMRFSSPSVGRGLNLHNLPKRDYAVAEPIRKVFRLPPEWCFVRGDLANVELRVEGFLTRALNIKRMFDPEFGGDYFNDPYSLGWKEMTGVEVNGKKDPVRQVSKAAHLGLGFSMGVVGFAKKLLEVLSDPKSGVKEDNLKKIIVDNNWKMPHGDEISRVIKQLGCSQIVATAAYHVHRLFNETYPEYQQTANWLVNVATKASECGSGGVQAYDIFMKHMLPVLYRQSAAPDPALVGIEAEYDSTCGNELSLRVRCGPWPRTVCWRCLKNITETAPGARSGTRSFLSILKSSGERKQFTRQLAIENLTQAAARNELCRGVKRLHDMGYPDCIHVHDEALIIVPRKREIILAARDALIKTFSPDSGMPMKWAVIMNPAEITVTESMYESELDIQEPKLNEKTGQMEGNDRWRKIEQGTEDCLLNLP